MREEDQNWIYGTYYCVVRNQYGSSNLSVELKMAGMLLFMLVVMTVVLMLLAVVFALFYSRWCIRYFYDVDCIK